MKRIASKLIALSLTIALTSAAMADRQPLSAEDMLATIKPSIVKIIALNHSPSSQEDSHAPGLSKVGSGVVVDAKHGLIATNAHVLEEDGTLIVTLHNGERYHGHIVGMDKSYDLAVISINNHDLSSIKIANSDHAKVGDTVYAIGSPFGLEQTVTSGLISARNRAIPGKSDFQNYIQTDASINMGNSGGPLVDAKGRLIGINTASIVPDAGGSIGIGFAIPSNVVKAAIKQLIEYGKIRCSALGVIVQPITPDLARALKLNSKDGALITEVIADSPAAKAGLKPMDLITQANDWEIRDGTDLHNLMGLTAPDSTIHFHLIRNGRKITTNATSGDKNILSAGKTVPFLAGMHLEGSKVLEPNSDQVQAGVFVLDVSPESQAILAGLMPGDLIIAANHHQTPDLKKLIAQAKKANNTLLLKVHRNGRNLYVVINQDH